MIYTHCPRLIKTSNPLITAANMASVVASALALLAACPLLASATHEYPDCANGPLKNNSVCDTSLPAKVRAQAFVDALTFHEKINITNNDPADPKMIVDLGRALALRLLDELAATTAYIGDIEAAIIDETADDPDARRRQAMLRAVDLPRRAGILKDIATASRTLVHRHSQKIQSPRAGHGATDGLVGDPHCAACTF